MRGLGPVARAGRGAGLHDPDLHIGHTGDVFQGAAGFANEGRRVVGREDERQGHNPGLIHLEIPHHPCGDDVVLHPGVADVGERAGDQFFELGCHGGIYFEASSSSRAAARTCAWTDATVPSMDAPAARRCPPPPKRAARRATSTSPTERNEILILPFARVRNSIASRTPSTDRGNSATPSRSSESTPCRSSEPVGTVTHARPR